jgi:hypothetical protein
MAERRPLVIDSGLVQQFPIGDLLPLDMLPAGAVSGHCITLENVGVSLIPGSPVYVSGDAEVSRAKADAAGTSAVIGLAAVAIGSTALGAIQVDGLITLTTVEWDAVAGTTGGLVPNTVYYLTPISPPPSLSSTPTTGSGNYIVVVGRAISSTVLKIQISEPIVIP